MPPPPVPAPRTIVGTKKPIPAPRTLLPIRSEEDCEMSANNNQDIHTIEGKNTFRRKVQTISNDIGERVIEGKKAVIESTRQSVRKITRRFTDNSIGSNEDSVIEPPKENVNLDIFKSISFESPIQTSSSLPSNSTYSNGDDSNGNYENFVIKSKNGSFQSSSSSPNEDDDLPPPSYPPPPLPFEKDETYDVPSVVSGDTTSSENEMRYAHKNYESVFPSYPYNSDSESCVDMTSGTIDRNVRIESTASWNFYDSVQKDKKEEHTYNNVDSMPAMSPTCNRVSRANSMYENYDITVNRRPTESVLMEFDPLRNIDDFEMTPGEELSEFEKAIHGHLHGSINLDQLSIFDDVSEADDEYISPPPPPIRTDSLIDSESLGEPSSPKTERKSKTDKDSKESDVKRSNSVLKTRTSWYLGNQGGKEQGTESKLEKIWGRFKTSEFVKRQFTKKDNLIPRPMIQPKSHIQQKGMLFRIMHGPVEDLFGELNARWCVLQPGILLCHSDNSCDNIKENIPIETILSIQVLQEQKVKYKHDEDELFCFEMNIAGKVRTGYVFGTKSQSERRVWMQNIADNMCQAFGTRITSDYKRMGWTYMKVGVNGQWRGAWICLVRRKLYYMDDNITVKTLDLRKARFFKLEPYDETCPSTTDKGPNFVVHFTSETYYFRMWTQRVTKVWCHVIKLAARDNGPNLSQQQLTKDDVPVIVEKCINFLYVEGSMTEGIYRRAGSNSTVAELMNQFRTDAWSVQLTDKYSAHDVANVLKRFFRELAEPLIDGGKRQYLYQVSLVKDKDEKVRMYKGIFDQVHKITYNTTKRLLGHLYFISTQSNKNLMSIINLASIWGPTLLHGSTDDGNKDRLIIAQLIELYSDIFPDHQLKKEQEEKMLHILQKYNNSFSGNMNTNQSGDFRMWVYLYNKEGKNFNMLVGPNKTAYMILCELSDKVKVPVHELVLEEQVLNDTLTRPIHHTEKVLDVVLKWGYWDDDDRKENCLILNNISKYWEYLNDNNLPLSAELKYADNKTKSFKAFKFEFQQAKLTYYKERQSNNMLGQWNIEDIFLYFGSEPKRHAPFTMTFFPRSEYPTRNKQRPYFGHILSFPDPAMKATWVSTMWRAEHQNNLTPPPQHVNLMSA